MEGARPKLASLLVEVKRQASQHIGQYTFFLLPVPLSSHYAAVMQTSPVGTI
jgi:hypothetical protein